MRLIHVDTLEFAEYVSDEGRPKYAIASYRWISGFEAKFQEVRDKRNPEGLGYSKVKAFAQYVKDNIPSVEWLWIDTCCINKESAAELSEAINSMFEWYRNAEVCLAQLAYVLSASDKEAFAGDVWFTRGWTLQELLASRIVVFLTKTWEVDGHKGRQADRCSGITLGPSLEPDIARITGLPEQVLRDYSASRSLTVDEKLRWMHGRTTMREEDMAYALLGILNVSMPAIYGEKKERAMQRLLAAARLPEDLAAQQSDNFRKMLAWLSPPDPWENHRLARQRFETLTGEWLLRSDEYLKWRACEIRSLWISGKAGSGKTVLCSTVIEDLRARCASRANFGLAIFYFSFSDGHKQSDKDLLRSLVAQLAWKEPGLSMLQQAYDSRISASGGSLDQILFASLSSYEKIYIVLDALDESNEHDDVRQAMLERLESLLRDAPNVQVLVTSREVHDIRESTRAVGAETLPIDIAAVDEDIGKYVRTQLSRDPRLSRLDTSAREMIEKTLTTRADGMFRWAYCQLQELKRLRSTRPKDIEHALRTLPKTLDETYERMLAGIDECDHAQALTLLRWIAYAKSPRTLAELAEAAIINPAAAANKVDINNRGDLEDTLNILSGLVVISEDVDPDNEHSPLNENGEHEHDVCIAGRRNPKTEVRLAHFSVKEYLESKRIVDGIAKAFHLDEAREHRHLAQSCLTYLMYYSDDQMKPSSNDDVAVYPLLHYTVRSWYYHSRLQGRGDVDLEVAFLTSKPWMKCWLLVHRPEHWSYPFRPSKSIGSGLYYASYLGLHDVARELIDAGAQVDVGGGKYHTPLIAASKRGYDTIVQILLDAGAGVNARVPNSAASDEVGRTALHYASKAGSYATVEMLLRAGADMEICNYGDGTPLNLAVSHKRTEVVRILLDTGANASATRWGRREISALHEASQPGSETILKLLINADANLDARDEKGQSVLHRVARRGSEREVKALIEAGADLHVRDHYHSSVLHKAARGGNERIVKLLIEAGADIHARDSYEYSVLHQAAVESNERVVRLLVEAGADVNAQDEYGASMLHLVLRSYATSTEIRQRAIRMLINAGAEVNARDLDGNDVL